MIEQRERTEVEKAAQKIVQEWLDDQLRQEGREGIYIDDIAVLTCDITDALKDQYRLGREAGLSEIKEYLLDYRKAYDESLCPPRKLEEFDGMLRTVVAFHMGRFLIDNMVKDVSALLSERGER